MLEGLNQCKVFGEIELTLRFEDFDCLAYEENFLRNFQRTKMEREHLHIDSERGIPIILLVSVRFVLVDALNEELFEGIKNLPILDPGCELFVEHRVADVKYRLKYALELFVACKGAFIKRVNDLAAAEVVLLYVVDAVEEVKEDGAEGRERDVELRYDEKLFFEVVLLELQDDLPVGIEAFVDAKAERLNRWWWGDTLT